MLRSRVGFVGAEEVVEVEFDPAWSPYEELVRMARDRGCANRVWALDARQLAAAGGVEGIEAALLSGPPRPARPEDRLYYLRQSPLASLELTPLQALRVNASLGSGGDAEVWLSPRQRSRLQELQRRAEEAQGREGLTAGGLRSASGPQEPGVPPEGRQDPGTSPDAEADAYDLRSLDGILAAVYGTLSGDAGERRDWPFFESLFLPEHGRLVALVRTPDGPRPHVMRPGDYIENVGPFLLENGFHETEVHRVVERFGNLAHVFSTYEGRRRREGEPFLRGVNSFQLVFDGERWWILSLAWQPEEEGLPLPARYLPGS